MLNYKIVDFLILHFALTRKKRSFFRVYLAQKPFGEGKELYMAEHMKQLLYQYSRDIADVYGKHLKSVILYGSYARGDFNNNSDIDIMILLDMAR